MYTSLHWVRNKKSTTKFQTFRSQTEKHSTESIWWFYFLLLMLDHARKWHWPVFQQRNTAKVHCVRLPVALAGERCQISTSFLIQNFHWCTTRSAYKVSEQQNNGFTEIYHTKKKFSETKRHVRTNLKGCVVFLSQNHIYTKQRYYIFSSLCGKRVICVLNLRANASTTADTSTLMFWCIFINARPLSLSSPMVDLR